VASSRAVAVETVPWTSMCARSAGAGSRIVGDRRNHAGLFDEASIPPSQCDSRRIGKGRVSEPDTHAAVSDQPQAFPSEPAEPLFDAHMVVQHMWLVSPECHSDASPAEMLAQ